MTEKERRPSWERKAIRALMVELGVNYTTALREYEKRKAEQNNVQDSSDQADPA